MCMKESECAQSLPVVLVVVVWPCVGCGLRFAGERAGGLSQVVGMLSCGVVNKVLSKQMPTGATRRCLIS